jgi:hypothetical protein
LAFSVLVIDDSVPLYVVEIRTSVSFSGRSNVTVPFASVSPESPA